MKESNKSDTNTILSESSLFNISNDTSRVPTKHTMMDSAILEDNYYDFLNDGNLFPSSGDKNSKVINISQKPGDILIDQKSADLSYLNKIKGSLVYEPTSKMGTDSSSFLSDLLSSSRSHLKSEVHDSKSFSKRPTTHSTGKKSGLASGCSKNPGCEIRSSENSLVLFEEEHHTKEGADYKNKIRELELKNKTLQKKLEQQTEASNLNKELLENLLSDKNIFERNFSNLSKGIRCFSHKVDEQADYLKKNAKFDNSEISLMTTETSSFFKKNLNLSFKPSANRSKSISCQCHLEMEKEKQKFGAKQDELLAVIDKLKGELDLMRTEFAHFVEGNLPSSRSVTPENSKVPSNSILNNPQSSKVKTSSSMAPDMLQQILDTGAANVYFYVDSQKRVWEIAKREDLDVNDMTGKDSSQIITREALERMTDNSQARLSPNKDFLDDQDMFESDNQISKIGHKIGVPKLGMEKLPNNMQTEDEDLSKFSSITLIEISESEISSSNIDITPGHSVSHVKDKSNIKASPMNSDDKISSFCAFSKTKLKSQHDSGINNMSAKFYYDGSTLSHDITPNHPKQLNFSKGNAGLSNHSKDSYFFSPNKREEQLEDISMDKI